MKALSKKKLKEYITSKYRLAINTESFQSCKKKKNLKHVFTRNLDESNIYLRDFLPDSTEASGESMLDLTGDSAIFFQTVFLSFFFFWKVLFF